MVKLPKTPLRFEAELYLKATVEDWDRIMAVNARGAFLCYKYAGLQMIQQGRGGRLIAASSVAGKQSLVHLLLSSVS
jgi:NAD(P)-dependent dehydrogenase (short-subunit alcohol dehydrogenase family)